MLDTEAWLERRHRNIMVDLTRRLATGYCAAATAAEKPSRIAIATPGYVWTGKTWELFGVEVQWVTPDGDVEAVGRWLDSDVHYSAASRCLLATSCCCLPLVIAFIIHNYRTDRARRILRQAHVLATPRPRVDCNASAPPPVPAAVPVPTDVEV